MPQGSVLGPVLFLLYINDLPSVVKSKVRLFAGDTIIYTTAVQSAKLIEDLKNLEAWEQEARMEFRSAKCEIMRFSRERNRTTLPPYMLHNHIIPVTNKYLGVNIQDDLKWRIHTDYITNKASTKLGFISSDVGPTNS